MSKLAIVYISSMCILLVLSIILVFYRPIEGVFLFSATVINLAFIGSNGDMFLTKEQLKKKKRREKNREV